VRLGSQWASRFRSHTKKPCFKTVPPKRTFCTANTKLKSVFFPLGLSCIGISAFCVINHYFTPNKVLAENKVKAALDPNEFKKFTLANIKKVNHNTSIFTFKLAPDEILGLSVASCIVTKADIGEDGKPVIRPYTPIDFDEPGFFELLIKKYPTGAMSKHIHSLKPGDTLEIKGPISKIPYQSNMKERIGMVAGGTGITPMLQVIRKVLSDPTDKTQISLIFANLTEEDILLKKELDGLAREYKNFRVYYTLDKPPAGWRMGKGFVSADMIKTKLPPPGPKNLIMVCGPDPMVAMIAGPKNKDKTQGPVGGLLQELGFTEDMVFKF